MCNILILEPGQMINKEKFFNMCYNNWHSWGMVTQVGDRLDIQRHVPDSGEIDPEEVWKAVERDIEYRRYLHVRHTTAGKTDLSNCHPFDVYYDPKSGRQVVFMHNGTLHMYKSRKPGTYVNSWVDDDDGPSDTQNFVNEVLIPFVAQADYGKGRGDITSDSLKVLLSKFWSTGNRGLLISNKDPFLLLGKSEWKEIEAEDGKGTVWSANDSYFDKVIRGPELARREAAEKERLRLENEKQKALALGKEGAQKASSNGPLVRTNLVDVNRRPRHPFFELSESIKELLNDWDFYGDDRDGRAALGYMTEEELEALYKEKETCLWVMDYMFTDYAVMKDELDEALDKKQKGELVIAAQKKRIQELEELLKKTPSEKAHSNRQKGIVKLVKGEKVA